MLKISQVAIYVPDHAEIKENFKRIFGEEFYSDKLKMDGKFHTQHFSNIPLHLSFNHNIFKSKEIEYELITSGNKFHWHDKIINERGDFPFLSHLGMYCADDEFADINHIMLCECDILQRNITKEHSHKRADGSERHYEDVIFSSEQKLGFNLKLTRRIP